MIKLFFGLLFFCTVTTQALAAGQDAGMDASSPLSNDAERNRIESERALAEAAYQRQEAVCYERFAVTDCIRQLRRSRREVFDRLRLQEIEINAAERKRKALDQLERIKEKSSDERLAEDALKRVEARAAQQEREQSAAQKTNASGEKKQLPAASPQALDQGLTPGEIAKNRSQYKAKLKEVEENRIDRLKSTSEKTDSSKKTLPKYP